MTNVIGKETIRIVGKCNQEDCVEGKDSGYCTNGPNHFDPYKLSIDCTCGAKITIYALQPSYKIVACSCGKRYQQQIENNTLSIKDYK